MVFRNAPFSIKIINRLWIHLFNKLKRGNAWIYKCNLNEYNLIGDQLSHYYFKLNVLKKFNVFTFNHIFNVFLNKLFNEIKHRGAGR